MTTDPELIKRMERHFRAVAQTHPKSIDPLAVEARAILALLPDPDLSTAGEIALRIDGNQRSKISPLDALRDAALAGIKHGRANPA